MTKTRVSRFELALGRYFDYSASFEIIGNSFNTLLVLLGFAGFAYWMNFQRKVSAKATVPTEAKDIVGWYKENTETKILK